MVKIAPSLMCMNISKFAEQINCLNQTVDYYHIDIMDGHYVSNMTLSPWFIEQLNNHTTIPMDAHLMVTNPIDYVEPLLDLGVEVISIHAEFLNGHAFRLSETIKKRGKKLGVVLNPETPLNLIFDYIHLIDIVTVMTVDPGFAGQTFISESLEKVKKLTVYRKENNLGFDIQIDGSCNEKTYQTMIEAGADILIVGTSGLFNLNESIEKSVEIMQGHLDAALSKT
ncbi:ribulose-phosphate 3-epimerase [Enterococcus gilvus]|jgi:D-allulose-6-phosphate 3-epimerase|uniref:D-allulose 6-phosphate 3-epimerase n=1 Tax=Enterococcus gilvus TaxID=160453 RepID=UPI000DF5C6C0|nr:D-allulose 6-phosphate 3-epimerase [Enterococcus gilvus]AXG38440.1 ribulose-phosphate 3-epimerase [Enterococcus gilvus]